MPFSPLALAGLAYAGGFTLWRYRSATDPASAIAATGYFNAAAHLLRAGDLVLAGGADGALVLAVTASGSSVVTATVRSGVGAGTGGGGSGGGGGGGGGGSGDAAATLLARGSLQALVSELPTTQGLVAHLDASDPLGHGLAALPANDTPVDFLLPRSGAPKGAVENAALPGRPRLRQGFDGAGRAALDFSAATPASLSMDGFNFPGGFTSTDQAATFAAVFRLKSPTSTAERTIAHVMPGNMTNALHFPSALSVLANGNIVFRMRDNFSANTEALFTWAANATETLIVIGRHAAATARNNRLMVRQGGATANVTATNGVAVNYAFNGAAPQLGTSARLGSRRFNNGATEENFFDGFLCELAIWNTDITDQQAGDLMSMWRAKWGVA